MSESQHDLIVVGGGPAGSTAASVAAAEGLDVLLLEAAQHPRAHVGESLLPGIIPILEKLEVLGAIEGAGFTRKTGSTHWGWGRTPEWDLWFRDSERYDHAWLVDRSCFDEILFRSAARRGARAVENASARGLLREGDRVVGVEWKERGSERTHRARAPLTLDATGQGMWLARSFELRTLISGLQHEASWAHYEGADRLPDPRSSQALFIATERAWCWHFPLSSERTSVGIIRLQSSDEGSLSEESRAETFDRTVAEMPRLADVLGPRARRVTPVRTVRDWSYRMSEVAGPGWMLVGDAAGFIDPVLSTGVLLAMHSGYHAGKLAEALARRSRREGEVLREYTEHHRSLFGDLVRMVKFFYQHNLHRDDYFWESKRILLEGTEPVSPRKAFMVLTSGLVKNLAFDEKLDATSARRASVVVGEGHRELSPSTPDDLRFVCAHLRYDAVEPAASLYLLIEPIDTASPTLFTTRNWHVNCLAPRWDNDPISDPRLSGPLRAIDRGIRALDDVPNESLGAFWRRRHLQMAELLRALPPELEVVRVFGE